MVEKGVDRLGKLYIQESCCQYECSCHQRLVIDNIVAVFDEPCDNGRRQGKIGGLLEERVTGKVGQSGGNTGRSSGDRLLAGSWRGCRSGGFCRGIWGGGEREAKSASTDRAAQRSGREGVPSDDPKQRHLRNIGRPGLRTGRQISGGHVKSRLGNILHRPDMLLLDDLLCALQTKGRQAGRRFY